jgi:hypothetical protein
LDNNDDRVQSKLCDSIDHIFPVEIDGTKTVGVLKKIIKGEKTLAFQHIDADALVLFKVSTPIPIGLT